ncbi:MAG: helix-turn-helix domain-containing protein [Armatimonadetes bacterium]|nr:helix-turn-helix domain-containing protein [Armatimonadota bacterium]
MDTPDWSRTVLVALLGAEARVAVLTWLCQHLDQPVHTRELARRCGLAPNQTSQQLHRLERIGLLRSERVGRSRVYRVDPAFPLLPELRSIVLKTTGLAGRLRDALGDLPVEVAFIFGSVAAGEDTRDSDVDLLVIGDLSGRVLAGATQPLQAEVGRPLNAVRYDAAEFRAKVRRRDAFVAEVLAGPKVFVRGGPDDLRRLVG